MYNVRSDGIAKIPKILLVCGVSTTLRTPARHTEEEDDQTKF